MAERLPDSLNWLEPSRRIETDAPAIFDAADCGSTADLIALVQQALAMADAKGLIFVGIDLCSALERLKEMGDTGQYRECRVVK